MSILPLFLQIYFYWILEPYGSVVFFVFYFTNPSWVWQMWTAYRFSALVISSYGTWISEGKKDFSSSNKKMYFFLYTRMFFAFFVGRGGLLKSFKFALICNNNCQTQKADYSTYRKKWLAWRMFFKALYSLNQICDGWAQSSSPCWPYHQRNSTVQFIFLVLENKSKKTLYLVYTVFCSDDFENL